MNIEIFFHDCFTTSNEYKKVIISIEKDGKYYLFGAVCNKQTNKIEVQRFAERDEKNAKFLIHGRKGYAKKYQDMTANELQIVFKDCIYALPRAMSRFFQLNIPFDDIEKKEIRDVISSCINRTETATEEINSVPPWSWVTVDLTKLTGNEIAEISKLISTVSINNTPTNAVIYNNKMYRLIEENNRYVLQECYVLQKVENSEPIAEEFIADDNSVNSTVRNFISMAKIINAENLADIINGNFYPIIDKRDVNGKNYYIIDVNGNNKAVSSNRIKEINVYTESPI